MNKLMGVAVLIFGLSSLFPIESFASTKPCKNIASITLSNALELENKQNQEAKKYTGVAQWHRLFLGLKYVPSDVKIVKGATSVSTRFLAVARVLPSIQARALGSQGTSIKAECVVLTSENETWYVARDVDGILLYFQPMNNQ